MLDKTEVVHKLYAEAASGVDFVMSDATPDRMGDIVEVAGWELQNFNRNPIALFNHNPEFIVGKWTDIRVHDGALRGRLELAAEGTSPRIDEIRKLVQAGILRAVSVGFRSIEREPINKGRSERFKKQELVEASLVAVPANANTLAMAKSLGTSADTLKLVFKTLEAQPPDSSGSPKDSRPAVKSDKAETPAAIITKASPKQERTKMPKTIAENISANEASRAALVARMKTLMDEAGEKGETLTDTAAEEYDTAKQDVERIDKHLVRLHEQEALVKESVKPVETAPEQTVPTNAKSVVPRVTSVKANIQPNARVWRFIQALAIGKGDQAKSLKFAKHAVQFGGWGNTPEIADLFEHDLNMLAEMTKAAVPGGLTTDATWAGPLIFYQQLTSEFAEYLRPLTILGRIQGFRRVPFNVQIPRATTGTSVGAWIGESAPKPVTSMAFDSLTLRWAKAAVIVVMSDELIRFSNPSAEAVVRDDLTRAMVYFLDTKFLSTDAAVTNVSPAGMLNGVTGITPTGSDMTAFRADVSSLFQAVFALNLPTASGTWVMTQTQATKLSLALNSFGQPLYPGVTAQGGMLMGYPVVASENIASSTGSPTEGYPLIFLIPSEILLADDGMTMIDSSNQASVQQDSAPDSPPTASTAYISLWQTNQTALRAERWITWAKRRTGCVQFIDRAKYAG